MAIGYLAVTEVMTAGGRGEIRTRGALRHTCTPSKRTRPLCDPSKIISIYIKIINKL
jgi:hypothetical protein